jgi:hypothetical protein
MKHFIFLALVGLVTQIDIIQAHKALVEDEPIEDEDSISAPDQDKFFEELKDENEKIGEDNDFKLPKPTHKSIKEHFFDFFQHEPAWYYQNCLLEMSASLFFMVAIFKYQMGNSQNKKIAENFALIVVPALFDDFPHLGCNSEGRSQ